MFVRKVTYAIEADGTEGHARTRKILFARHAILRHVKYEARAMNVILLTMVPLVMFLLQNAFRAFLGRFDKAEFAMDLHLSGLIMMMPLPLVKPEMAETLVYVIVLSATALLLTGACYMICILNPRRTFYEKLALGIGLSFLLLGLVLTICLLK